MKKYLALLVVAITFIASCSVTKKNTSTMKFADNPVVAHRGAFKKNNLPENSIASLKQAIALGCTGSEFDVWMTADDSLVIHHDPDYNKLDIEKTSFNQLRETPLANGEKLPSLREYLLAGMENNTKTRLVLEIKPSRITAQRGRAVADKVLQLVRELKAEPMIVYISFDYGILDQLRKNDPKAILQYLNGDHSPEQLKAETIQGADYHYSVFRSKPQWIDEAKKNKIQLNAWTVNDTTDMKWLLNSKFDFITTNEPEKLLELTKN